MGELMRKPRIFIGSSVEGLYVADAVNVNLDHSAEVTIWRNGTFDLSSTALDSLVKKAQNVDFALFVFSPDDIAIIRSKEKAVVRDNVLFELGLFIGSIGKERCFILKPRDVDLHFPTDLIGVTPADYQPNRSDSDIASAVAAACSLVKKRMDELGLRGGLLQPQPITKIKNEAERPLNNVDLSVLSALLETLTESPSGLTISWIKSKIKKRTEEVNLSAVRLERMGYVQRRNAENQDGYEIYLYLLTEEGVEILLTKGLSLEGMEDEDLDIPF
jgi:Predicted nucleotide-binding protein containing TIR-like domain